MLVNRDEFEIVFVTNYWDLPLDGLCKYKGELYKFKITWYDEEPTERYVLEPLSIQEKLFEIFRKKMFEWMVGYHWTYINGKRNSTIQLKPRWLRWLYYNCVKWW